VFEILLGLIQDESPVVLDLGCGTGDIGRGLAPYVTRVDAVDPSTAMIARGRTLPRGQNPAIHWITSTAEDFTYSDRYALIVTAESLHWMDWYKVLPRVHRSLTSHGRLAIPGRRFRNEPWAEEVGRLIARYSTNRDFEPYDLLAELAKRNLFVPERRVQTQPVPFTQTVDDYVESFHSRNGLSRDRMGQNAFAFDDQLRSIVAQYQPGPLLKFELEGELAWGIPIAG
jgi:SAM-dependent methyltransferase